MSRPAWINPVVPWPEATATQRQVLEAAWRKGVLDFLLTPSQAETYRRIKAWQYRGDRDRVFALDISRRWGKSALCAMLALEGAIRHPGWRVVFGGPTERQGKAIALDLFERHLQFCPPGLRPEYQRSLSTYFFKNNSRIEIVGLDRHPDAARGTGVDWVVIDEAGFFDNLAYVLTSIVYPQMVGRPHAALIAASTPPETPAHYWSTDVVPDCIKKRAHERRTLDDADQYSADEIEREWERLGGRDSITARREYGAEHIADATLQIVPEFSAAEAHIVKAVEPPVWRDCYVALDPGFHDMSAVLFGYWWFSEETLVIEDEIVAPRLNSAELAARIKRKEDKLWSNVRRRGGSQFETKPQPYLRVSDNDPRLIADMHIDHGLRFIATQKDNLRTQVNQVRIAIQGHKILIHPRCSVLVKHLRAGVWKKPGTLFGRDDEQFGHFDAIAALVYLWRNVHKHRNPVPQLERYVAGDLKLPAEAPGVQSKWLRKGNTYFIRGRGRVA